MLPTVPSITPVTIPFPQWTLSTAQSIIHVPAWMRTNRLFYEGDHWQDGFGWVGPIPEPFTENAHVAIAEIARGFTSENVLQELVDRRRDGVIGREPTWSLVPRSMPPRRRGGEQPEISTTDQALIDEANALLVPWWDENGLHETLQGWCATMLWARRSLLRAFVPVGFLRPATANGVPVLALQVRDGADALRQLTVEHTKPEHSTVYENPRTRERAGVYLYTDEGQQRAELVYVDAPTQATLVQQLGGALQRGPTRFNLGGRLTMYEAQHADFITEQQRQMQRALNLSLSLLPRNIVTGGFLEMVVTNGQMPGHWVADATMANGKRFVPLPMKRGAGVVNWIEGIELGENKEGSEDKVATPGVHFRPPTPVTHAIEANGELYLRMLNAAQQVHVLLNGDAGPSGISRTEARHEFIKSLRPTRARTQRAGRWLIETALAWVEFTTGRPGYFTSRLRCDFVCQIDAGPLSVEERAQNTSDVEAGLLSEETAQEWAGIEDTEAERQRIADSPRGRLRLVTEQAAAVQAWNDAGVPLREAMTYVGLDPADVTRMANAADREPEESTDPNAPRPGTTPPASEG